MGKKSRRREKQAPDNEVGKLRYTKRAWLRVTTSKFGGKPYIHIRLWELDGDGHLCAVPRKGIGLRPDAIKPLRKMLREALEQLPAEYQ